MHLGIVPAPVLGEGPSRDRETVFLGLDSQSLFVYADGNGWYEPAVSIGEFVEQGQRAALVYDLFRPDQTPRELHFDTAGLVIAKRLHAQVELGDCLFALGRSLEGSVT